MIANPSPSPWRIIRRPSINGAAIVAADGVRVGTISRTADKSIWQKEADAEVIQAAPVNAKIADAARDLVALWRQQIISGASRSERNAAIDDVRERLMAAVDQLAPVRGFLALLTPEQRALALANTAEENLGDTEFRRDRSPSPPLVG